MCMQDLIIARAVTIRRVTGTSWDAASLVGTIPPSADRVALIVGGGAGAATLVRLLPDADSPALNSFTNTSTGDQYAQNVITATSLPGVFSQPVYVSYDPGATPIYEVILDPPLADAVQRGYGRLLTGGD